MPAMKQGKGAGEKTNASSRSVLPPVGPSAS